jgi:hypothetical protein
MSDDVLNKADRLMRRHRVFLAGSTPAPAPEDDDIPILTEAVEKQVVEAYSGLPPDEERMYAVLASELSHALEHRLAAEMPAILASAMAKLEDDLKYEMRAATENALRDFMAHRRQLMLPFDDEPQS